MANALAVELDEIRFHADFAVANDDLDVGFMTIGRRAASPQSGGPCRMGRRRPRGSSAARSGRWATTTTPDWPVEHGYVIEVEGEPSFRCRHRTRRGLERRREHVDAGGQRDSIRCARARGHREPRRPPLRARSAPYTSTQEEAGEHA